MNDKMKHHLYDVSLAVAVFGPVGLIAFGASKIYVKLKRKKNMKNKIDVWNLDHSLAKIIHPALIEFKEKSVSLPCNIDLLDAPNIKEDDRWSYIIDEMIWSFSVIADEDIDICLENKDFYDRVDNGVRLFGKYYRDLWI